jgi:CheY-like chemotaxis protein
MHARPDRALARMIALTANLLPEDVTRCIGAGMSGHLGKPVSAEDLRQLFAMWFRKERRRRSQALPSKRRANA